MDEMQRVRRGASLVPRAAGLIAGIVTAGMAAAVFPTATAWAGGPPGYVAADASEAVGTGEFVGKLVGFRATGATNDQAAANVIAACERAGGLECTSDEVTNENQCIVSVADDAGHVIAGGAGPTVEAARVNAIARAAGTATPLPATAQVVISACP